jgi:hypothetical protein
MEAGLLRACNGRRKENLSKIFARHILAAYQAIKGSTL